MNTNVHPAPRERAHVLVVDDDDDDRELVTRLLERTGLDAAVAEEVDPVAALTRLRRSRFDVVLLDYGFPERDGLVVLRGLRELELRVPVIVLTCHDEIALAVELMRSGAVDFLVKAGLTWQRLGESVRHALRLRASELATRAAQEALRASAELGRRILEASQDCIEILDLEGRILAMNAGGLRAREVPDLALVRGRSWLGFWSGEHRRAAEEAVAAAFAGGLGRFAGRCPSITGRPRWWDVVITPMVDAAGRPERLLASSRDMTEQRRQAEFEQQLLGAVCHDLRAPLPALVTDAARLVRELLPGAPLAEVAGRIERGGQQVTRLVRDLLAVTQLRGGRLPIDRCAANIHLVCRRAVDEVARAEPGHRVELRSEGRGEGRWDPDRLSQAIGNLIDNAVRHGAPGTPITVRSTDHGGRVQVRVHNEGKAIPPDVLPVLFLPRARGEAGHAAERGVGLGLFIVRGIVAAHGGSVTVRSTAVEGTTFCIDLPAGADKVSA